MIQWSFNTCFYLYNETVRDICMKAFLPEPVHVSFLNEHDCVIEFSTEFELHKKEVDLQ